MGQMPAESYTKCMEHTSATKDDVNVPSSDAIILWSEKMALFAVTLLISQPSFSG